MIVLLLGGARSGKSEAGEVMARRLGDRVTFVATATAGADDADMARRIAAHRRRRPAQWATVEAADGLVQALSAVDGPVLLDALGTWVARQPDFEVDADELCRVLRSRRGDTVVVSEEVGLGVHPASDAGRRFRDALGVVNQRVAAVADEVFLVMAGRLLRLQPV